MRNAKLLGIIAAVAVMGGLLISCGPEPSQSEEAPEGELILSADYGAFVGYPIKATPLYVKSKSGQVSIAWFKTTALVYANAIKAANETDPYTDEQYEEYLGNITIQDLSAQEVTTSSNSSQKGTMFRPTEAGNYVAGLVDYQALDDWKTDQTQFSLPRFLFSDPIEVKGTNAIPTAYSYFFGDWKMTGTQQTQSLNYDEDVKIGSNLFYLIDVKDGSFFNFVINDNGWTVKSGTAPTGLPNDYTTGYTLTGNTTARKNPYPALTSFDIWTNGSQITFYRTTGNGVDVIDRVFKKVHSPEEVPLVDPIN